MHRVTPLLLAALSVALPRIAVAQPFSPRLEGTDERPAPAAPRRPLVVAFAPPPAAPPAPPALRASRGPFGLTLAGGTGAVLGTRFAATASVELLVRYRVLTAGLLLQGGVQPSFFGPTGRFGAVGAEVGVTFGGASGLRTDVLAVVGRHDYVHAGSRGSLFSDDYPGVDGDTTFAGARVNLSYRWRGPVAGIVGASVFVHRDLDVRTVRGEYTESGFCWFGCDNPASRPTTVSVETQLGETQVGLQVRAGVEADFGT
jgi:hypothetical protein